MTCGRDSDLLGTNEAARSLDAFDRASRTAPDAGDLTILDDIYTAGIGCAGIAPSNRIMARGAPATLKRAAKDRITHRSANVQRRTELLAFLRTEPLVVDSVQSICMNVPFEALHVLDIVGQHQNAARRVHDVIVQSLRQTLPQFQRVLVKSGALVE